MAQPPSSLRLSTPILEENEERAWIDVNSRAVRQGTGKDEVPDYPIRISFQKLQHPLYVDYVVESVKELTKEEEMSPSISPHGGRRGRGEPRQPQRRGNGGGVRRPRAGGTEVRSRNVANRLRIYQGIENRRLSGDVRARDLCTKLSC